MLLGHNFLISCWQREHPSSIVSSEWGQTWRGSTYESYCKLDIHGKSHMPGFVLPFLLLLKLKERKAKPAKGMRTGSHRLSPSGRHTRFRGTRYCPSVPGQIPKGDWLQQQRELHEINYAGKVGVHKFAAEATGHMVYGWGTAPMSQASPFWIDHTNTHSTKTVYC